MFFIEPGCTTTPFRTGQWKQKKKRKAARKERERAVRIASSKCCVASLHSRTLDSQCSTTPSREQVEAYPFLDGVDTYCTGQHVSVTCNSSGIYCRVIIQQRRPTGHSSLSQTTVRGPAALWATSAVTLHKLPGSRQISPARVVAKGRCLPS